MPISTEIDDILQSKKFTSYTYWTPFSGMNVLLLQLRRHQEICYLLWKTRHWRLVLYLTCCGWSTKTCFPVYKSCIHQSFLTFHWKLWNSNLHGCLCWLDAVTRKCIWFNLVGFKIDHRWVKSMLLWIVQGQGFSCRIVVKYCLIWVFTKA